jgi:5-formyltetrahydrofolate cyclo-ligase
MGRTVAVPVIGRNAGFMDLFRFRPDTRLVLNRLGIAEPETGSQHVNVRSVVLMLMPLVAFDDSGTRLGMGGGFYDRFLGALPPGLRPRLIGLAHEAQHSAATLPRDHWDIPLDAVITEAGVTHFHPHRATRGS